MAPGREMRQTFRDCRRAPDFVKCKTVADENQDKPNEQQPAPLDLKAGQSAGSGRYLLKKFLGQGGMGIVWLAQDKHLGGEVALKFLPGQLRLDSSALDDLRQETLKSRKLTHPNIIRIHDLFSLEGGGSIHFHGICGRPHFEQTPSAIARPHHGMGNPGRPDAAALRGARVRAQ